ncbi:Spermidine/putrescine import ATP-binding protein PotA [Defluviimonas aquaemixtae]|uniref:Spermidine/putrescine import ATP-binding protein PotA n=1 Tax=Albidovulum aquaemixtae TaxID=1542388 RepID=A0A2R8B3R5_9RHOB|nr:ABC transporter ATP-binding protein [Defluviimonas aquaemixtae]SPH17259.1 Spermidine/putrescine import ATP-binding protein PotA [Defluviimonas aquaemixtae]
MNGPIIRLEGVEKVFGEFRALKDITFDIAPGEFFSLLGASGCGKTTLLRILAGIEQPTRGEVTIDGKPMAGVPANKRPTNMVFQSYAIFPHLTVRENIGYGLVYQKLAKAEAKARTDEAIELVKLAGLGERSAHQLSGGQRQRVALARALVCRPKVLLLDEPLSALDKKLREEMQQELRSLQRTVGITFVFVTHDQEEALTLSDRIAVMSGGRVLQIDTPQGLYERPNCLDVAGFVGTMNLFPAKVTRAEGSRTVANGAGMGELVGHSHDRPSAVGAAVFIAVRPEKIVIEVGANMPGLNRLVGRISSISYLGDRSHYLVEVEGLAEPVAVYLSNPAGRALHGAAGAEVTLSWDETSALVLER